jgi:hypothetical protein
MSVILNFKNWKKMYEQQVTHSAPQKTQYEGPTRTWTNDPESMKIMLIFTTEFIPSLIGDYKNLTFAEYTTKLTELLSPNNREKLSTAIQFFKDKGYPQPNPKIKKFQEDMMSSTDYKTFTTTDNKTEVFNDGKFGSATSAAIINYMISKFKTLADQKAKVKDFISGSVNVDAERAAKVNTSADVKTGTGVQTLK